MAQYFVGLAATFGISPREARELPYRDLEAMAIVAAERYSGEEWGNG